MRPTRGAAILATAAVMAGGLTACGEDEPTQPTTTASPIDKSTETETPSPSNSTADEDPDNLPADMPAAAREQTKAGAAAFGKYYLIAYGDAAMSANTTVLESLGSEDCATCSTAISDIEEDRAKGWTKDKNPYTVTSSVATKRPDEGFKVVMEVNVARHNRIDSAGNSNGLVEATSYTVTEHVIWDGDKWQMRDWVVT